MTILDLFAFKTAPVTFLFLVVYAAIFLFVAVFDDLPSVPDSSEQHGLDINRAYADLHKVAGIPHPYMSRQNDEVRKYILKRVQTIASTSSFITVDNDLVSNATYSHTNSNVAVYFEGLNILVKVEGLQSQLDGILLSAHFDSVSTAPGATDDGMGVVTLISLIEYFSKHRPKRTLVFNINNGEEDYLNGAHAFLEHPWSNLATSFINLEGAGAGGRPLLLRSTTTSLARAWKSVPHPHALVMSADAFNRGVVRSATDYTVYTTAGLAGLDFSFYRRRSLYHTRDDSIPSLGGRSALWSMMESTLFSALTLIDGENGIHDGPPVYFDLFGEALVVTSLKMFYIINIILLVVPPIAIGVSLFFLRKQGKLYWSAKGWGRTLGSIVISGALSLGLGWIYVYLNPFIIHSSQTSVLISSFSLSLLSMYFLTALSAYYFPVPQQKMLSLLECFVLWWILLTINTVLIGQVQISGLYFITFSYVGVFSALLVGLLKLFTIPSSNGLANNEEASVESDDRETASERTPLLDRANGNNRPIQGKEIDESEELATWILQFLLAVPFPVILLTQIAVMLVNAINQTLVDGSPAETVYFSIALISVLGVVPSLPFLHKLSVRVAYALAAVLVASFLYNILSFPFSEGAPFKVFFQQTVDLDSGENLVQLTGSDPYLSSYVLPEIPSSWDVNTKCNKIDSQRGGLPSCLWKSFEPHPSPGDPSSWMTVNASLSAPGIGSITIRGEESRGCRIYFDTGVKTVSVQGAKGGSQEGFPLPTIEDGGIKEFRLWSRKWNRTFEVGVTWDAESPLIGKVACDWAEGEKIPALQEVISFLPKWARVTKRTDGLLEGYKTFELS